MASAGATSMRALSMEFKALEREPVEGFLVTIPDESDFYTWQVAIFGPPETPYEGGYFKVKISCHFTLCSVIITIHTDMSQCSHQEETSLCDHTGIVVGMAKTIIYPSVLMPPFLT